MRGYAVIDVETTGFNKLGNDRVAELAVATFDHNFNLTGKYETLLNPERDLGMTSLHGINGLMASEAPKFHEIMNTLAPLLHGRIIVGHNVRFDLKFLASEYLRQRINIDWEKSYIDTYSLARSAGLDVFNYKLGTLCDFFGIKLNDAHTAMADVMATADLLKRLLRFSAKKNHRHSVPMNMSSVMFSHDYSSWLTRKDVEIKMKPAYSFNKFLSKLPFNDSSLSEAQREQYFTSLHLALINGSYSSFERRQIEKVTYDLSLSKNQVIHLHEEYLQFHICKNLRKASRGWFLEHCSHMETAVQFTEFPESRFRTLINETVEMDHLIPAGLTKLNSLFSLTAKDGIVLTGEDFAFGKEHWTAKIAEAGLILKNSTTKQGVKAVICNDPYSLSKKAVTAREFGIPILTEATATKFIR